MKLGNSEQKRGLLDLYSIQPQDPKDKVSAIKDVFLSTGSAQQTKLEIQNYTQKAFEVLDELEISEDKKVLLRKFGESLMQRSV